jgi:hypothetical protein
LKVYDLLGREIKTIVNETQQAGKYNMSFSAASLSSGMYFYQLRTENFLATKTMMVIK